MLKCSKRASLLAFVLGIALLIGIVQLLVLRLEHGDVYVPYSTLRSDPLGAKVLYQALSEMPGLQVSRNYRPVNKLTEDRPQTWVYAGTPHDAIWREGELEQIEWMVRQDGMRLIITFLPADQDELKNLKPGPDAEKGDATKTPLENEAAEGKEPKKEEGGKTSNVHGRIPFQEVAVRWGFSFAALSTDPSVGATAVDPEALLEKEITWHSAIHLKPIDPAWVPAYAVKGEPVVIERKFGKGTIVLAGDSYFLGNEALRAERNAKLLSWLIGSGRSLVFDEESHGVREQPGVASLIRKYGLQGAMAGVVLLALLFAWKNYFPLVPIDGPGPIEQAVSGRRAEEGLTNLLHRSIAPRELVAVCAQEWEKSFPRERETMMGLPGDPVAAYGALVARRARTKPLFSKPPCKST